MAANFTANARLWKPAVSERNWDVPLNSNADFLDGLSAIGRLLVTTSEQPSSSLNVRVTAGSYRRFDGSIGDFAGNHSFTLPGSSATFLWLSDAGQLAYGPVFPFEPHVRLARVVTAASVVSSIIDERLCFQSAQASGGVPALSGGNDLSPSPALFKMSARLDGSTIGVSTGGDAIESMDDDSRDRAARLVDGNEQSIQIMGDAIELIGNEPEDSRFASLAIKLDAVILTLQRHGLLGRS
jgi:hypothetical protein